MAEKIKLTVTSLGKVVIGGVTYKNGDVVEVNHHTANYLENNVPQLASRNAKKVKVKESKKESDKSLKKEKTEIKSAEKVKG